MRNGVVFRNLCANAKLVIEAFTATVTKGGRSIDGSKGGSSQL